MKKPNEYRIRRQTNAGRNQGKWTVIHPRLGTVVGGLEKWRAKWIAAVFNIAAEHPTQGQYVPYQLNFNTGGEQSDGTVGVYCKDK